MLTTEYLYRENTCSHIPIRMPENPQRVVSGENVLCIFRKPINSVMLHYVMQKGIGLSLRLLQKFCGTSEKGETCHFQVVCLMNIPT